MIESLVNESRRRARQNFPVVLLTLLSIVQALALELLWSHVTDSETLFQPSLEMAIEWMQIVSVLLGLTLIWLSYANTVMRLRWAPSSLDSVYPFVVGLLEFMAIEVVGASTVGMWLLLMAVIFGSMVVATHFQMRRARQDGGNEEYFSRFEVATIRDFYPQIIIFMLLVALGLFLWTAQNTGVVALIGVMFFLGLMLWQFVRLVMFWEQSMRE